MNIENKSNKQRLKLVKNITIVLQLYQAAIISIEITIKKKTIKNKCRSLQTL